MTSNEAEAIFDNLLSYQNPKDTRTSDYVRACVEEMNRNRKEIMGSDQVNVRWNP